MRLSSTLRAAVTAARKILLRGRRRPPAQPARPPVRTVELWQLSGVGDDPDDWASATMLKYYHPDELDWAKSEAEYLLPPADEWTDELIRKRPEFQLRDQIGRVLYRVRLPQPEPARK